MVDSTEDDRAESDPWAGWVCFRGAEDDTFISTIGPSYARWEGGNRATVMVETRPLHRNAGGALHGGMIATFADHAGFAALNAMGRKEQLKGGSTVDLTLQFIGAGRVGPAVRADVEILRETGRLFFARMTFSQDEELIAAATITFRKPTLKKP